MYCDKSGRIQKYIKGCLINNKIRGYLQIWDVFFTINQENVDKMGIKWFDFVKHENLSEMNYTQNNTP